MVWLAGATICSLLRIPFAKKLDLLAKFGDFFGEGRHFCMFLEILRVPRTDAESMWLTATTDYTRRSAFVCSCFLQKIKVQRRRVLPSTIQFLC